jgi:hypothetical protein
MHGGAQEAYYDITCMFRLVHSGDEWHEFLALTKV